MNVNVIIDWKFVVALGISAVYYVLASKTDAASAERVLTVTASACHPLAVAANY